MQKSPSDMSGKLNKQYLIEIKNLIPKAEIKWNQITKKVVRDDGQMFRQVIKITPEIENNKKTKPPAGITFAAQVSTKACSKVLAASVTV